MITPDDVRPDTLLFLRQGGLRDDLVLEAARAGHPGWWDPGIVLFHEVGERLGRTARAPCGPFERLVLVERALEGAGEFFRSLRRRDAFVDAADRLFGELAAEGIDAGDLESALQRGAARDGFQRERDLALTRAYRAYLEALTRADRRDGRDDVVDAALALTSDPAACATLLGGRTLLRFAGLQDLAGGWPRLLAALAAHPAVEDVEVQSAVALDLAAMPAVSAKGFRLANGLGGRLLAPEPASEARGAEAREAGAGAAGAGADAGEEPLPAVAAFSAHGADRETEEVAVRVRELLDAGVDPRTVCVVARSGRPYTDLVLRALERVGVPGTARRRRRLERIPVVRALLTLFAAAADGWTRHGLAELAEQPYIGSDLDAVVLNHIGFRRRVTGLAAWASALRRLLEEAEQREREPEEDGSEAPERRAPIPPSDWVRQTLDGFRRFAEWAGELQAPRVRGEWLEWLAETLERDPWRISELLYRVPDGSEELVRWDAAGWEGLRRVVSELRAGEAAWGGAGEPIGVAAFASFLRAMLKGDAAIWTPMRTGVRVLEAAAAAYRSFEHVFIVGLESGRWPLPPPASPLLEEGDRERLRAAGLPVRTRAHWERRERDLFAVVAGSAARTLTVSWSRVDERGEPTVASGFVEDLLSIAGVARAGALPTRRVLTPGVPLVADAAAAERARHAARVEAERASGAPGPWNGAIEDAELRGWLADRFGGAHVWSATSLEGVAKCPWAWFSGRLLRLEKQEDPDADLDPIARGNLYHDALRRFYEAAGARTGGPVRLRTPDLEWARPAAVEATRAAIAEASPRDAAALRAVPAALRDAKAAELERTLVRYLEWEAQYNEDCEERRKYSKYPLVRTAVAEHEVAFEDLELEVGGERLLLRGTIDRVEVGVDPRLADPERLLAAVDYKSTEYSVPARGRPAGWEDGVVLQLPLYAAALECMRPDRTVARMEYRAVRTRKVAHQLPLVTVAKDDATAATDETAVGQRAASLAAAGACARRVRAGAFPARPAPSCGCPPYCHGWDICRVPGGPRR